MFSKTFPSPPHDCPAKKKRPNSNPRTSILGLWQKLPRLALGTDILGTRQTTIETPLHLGCWGQRERYQHRIIQFCMFHILTLFHRSHKIIIITTKGPAVLQTYWRDLLPSKTTCIVWCWKEYHKDHSYAIKHPLTLPSPQRFPQKAAPLRKKLMIKEESQKGENQNHTKMTSKE